MICLAYNIKNQALVAKIHAMYGRRLNGQNYRELLRKQSVSEAASYLKQQTDYSRILADINENIIHRGQLENILRRQLFDEYIKMFFYIDQKERDFYNFLVTRMEIDEILSSIRFINAGRQGEYIFSLPSFFAKRANFDLFALAKVKTFDDLLELLSATPYISIISKYQPGQDGKIDILKLEIDLSKYYYEKILDIIDRNFKGKTKENLRNSFGTEIDLENIVNILRIKKYFNANASELPGLILPYYFKISKDELHSILQAPDIESTFKALFETEYGKVFKKPDYDFLEKYGQEIIFNYHRKFLVYSNSAPTIVVSYIHLKRVELNNIIHIIEGIRYGLPPSEISKLLIGNVD